MPTTPSNGATMRMRASCACVSATCASATSSAATLWSSALWLTKFCATSSRLRCTLVRAMPACASALLQLRLLQGVVELHQQLAAAHALAVVEAEPRDAAADLGAQHHALARTQRAHGLGIVLQRQLLDLADLDRDRAAGSARPTRRHAQPRCDAPAAPVTPPGPRRAPWFCHHQAATASATSPSSATQVFAFLNVMSAPPRRTVAVAGRYRVGRRQRLSRSTRGHAAVGQRVGALVARVAGMAP